MDKTETILNKIAEVLKTDVQTLSPKITFEWLDDIFYVHFRESLNVQLEISGKIGGPKPCVSYCPADGSQDGDYDNHQTFNLPTAIIVWDMLSRQLIDLRRIVVSSV